MHDVIVLPATFQTASVTGVVVEESLDTNRMLVTRTEGGTPKPGDSNAVWVNRQRSRTIGIHCSYDPTRDQTMSVLRIKKNQAGLEVNQRDVRRSGRKREADTVSRELFPSKQAPKDLVGRVQVYPGTLRLWL